MGVEGLWKLLQPAGQQRSIVHLSVHEGFLSNKHDRRGYRLGIDAYIWFFHAKSSREGENPELRMLFFRLARFLALPILPVFVFDGPAKPNYKRNKITRPGQHALTGSFKAMIEAFGFEWHQAPGEAEAELAYLNRIEVIDAVLSDDGDNFLFGARLVMRNPSGTLSGNKGHAMKNADGKVDDKHVRLYSAQDIEDHPNIQLTQGGCILIGLMSGGDYNTSGLSNVGIVISHALARAGFGDSLVNAFVANHHDPHALSNALSQWRTSLRHYLSTNPDRLLSKRHPSLANQISDAFPSLRVLEDYVMPQTSERTGHVPTFEWAKQPSLKEIANRCEMHYEWGVKPLILKRFRNVIWGGSLMQVLRASAMEGDERERRSAGVMQTPRKGRRAANVAVGTPSKLIARTLSRMELATPRAREVAYDDEKPLIVKIHSQRTHASTDGILEYRVEIAPEQFVQITEKGLLGLRGEDGIDVENFGKRRALMDDDLDFGGDEDEGGKAGKKAKGPVHPNDHLRIWVPACMLEVVEPRLVEEFEAIGEAKEQKKRDKERRAQEKAEGKVSPKKSRAKTTSPTKTKANKPAIDDDVFGPVDDWLPANVSQPSQRTSRPKAGPPKKFIDEDSSGDDVGPTPRPRSKAPLKTTAVSDPFPLLDSGERDDAVSETDYMSTGSITERRRGKVVELPRLELPPIPSTSFAKKKSAILTALESPTKPSPQVKKWPAARPKIIPSQSSQSSSNATRNFLFTMQPDVYDLDDDEDEGLEPYAALIGDNSGSSRASSGSQLGQVGHRGAIPQKKRVAVSKTMSRAFAGEEPMEDFSDLFSPMASPQVPELPSSQLSQSASRNGATKRHKFVSDDDLNDHSPVQKSPKKSKAHVSPRKQTNSAVPTNTTRPSKSAEKSATQAGQTSTTSSRMPASLQEVLADAPPSRGSWKKSKPVTKTNGGAVTEIIDLTSSDEDVFVAKPLKPTSSKPCGTAIQRSVATAAARPKLLEIIDLD